MSSLIAKNLQVGSDPTATNNFTIFQPATPDGTLRIGNGNTGITSSLLTLNSSGNLGLGVTPTTKLDIGANDSTPKTISLRYSSIPSFYSSTFDGSVGLNTISINTYNTSSGSTSWSAFSNTSYGAAAIQLASQNGGANFIRFLVGTAANTNPVETARIDSSGNLLLGTTSVLKANRRLQVSDGGGIPGILKQTNNAANECLDLWNSATSGNNVFVEFQTETVDVARGSISYNRAGGLTVYNTTSDYRAKDIYGPITDSGAVIDSTPVYMGKMKGATQERPMFIAHEVPAYAHTGEKDAVDADGKPVYQQMDASALVPVMWAEIQSLRQRLAAAGI